MKPRFSHFGHPSDDLGPNQACTLFGAQGGSSIISGTSYISAGYGLDPKDLWRRDFPVLVGFFILFQLTQIFALEFYPVRSLMYTLTYRKHLTICLAIWSRSFHKHIRERNRRDQEIEWGSTGEEAYQRGDQRKGRYTPREEVCRTYYYVFLHHSNSSQRGATFETSQDIYLGESELPCPFCQRPSTVAARRGRLCQTRHFDSPNGSKWCWYVLPSGLYSRY